MNIYAIALNDKWELKVLKTKILLLSGYDAPSHQYWRDVLTTQLTEFNWTQLVLPPRHFSWRIRGNAINFYNEYQAVLKQRFDLIIATSMVDLNNLCGLIPSLANTPKLLYFHENQFSYPLEKDNLQAKQNAINAQITSVLGTYCADRILFNSQFNFDSFFAGANQLSKRLPDGLSKESIFEVQLKSKILPVPINLSKHTRTNVNSLKVVKILWNHRWEFDKQPEVFVEAMKRLKQKGIEFKLFILGQSFRNKPSCLTEAKDFLNEEIEVFGYQPKEEYSRLMREADIVISSALHDFQGLSMLEAILSGCLPIAPHRVAYPEYIDSKFLYSVTDNEHTISDKNVCNESIKLTDKLLELLSSRDFSENREKLIAECQLKTDSYRLNNLISGYKHEIRKLID